MPMWRWIISFLEYTDLEVYYIAFFKDSSHNSLLVIGSCTLFHTVMHNLAIHCHAAATAILTMLRATNVIKFCRFSSLSLVHVFFFFFHHFLSKNVFYVLLSNASILWPSHSSQLDLVSFQILSPHHLIIPQIFCSDMFAVFMFARSKLMLFIPQC